MNSAMSWCWLTHLALLMCFRCSVAQQLYAVPDFFEVLNGEHVIQRYLSDDNGEDWSRKSDLGRLEVLTNDFAHSLVPVSCVLEGRRSRDDSHDEPLAFEERRQEAGFHHVYRDSMAVRPYCAFDFVIPNVNASLPAARLKGEFCIPEHICAGAAVGDYDNDGLLDIFFAVFHGRSVLYRNNGNGSFTDVTDDVGVGPNSFANGAGWVDVDQDGDLDLYVTSVGASRHHLYINYGGRFREEAEKRNCSLRFGDGRKLSGMTPNFGDFDQDGFPDVYVSEWILRTTGKPSASRLLRNKGYRAPGYFEDVTDQAGVNMDIVRSGSLNQGTYTFGSSFTDFDGDGLPELLVTADYGDSRMFWNDGSKGFRECTRDCGLRGEQDAMGHAIGDWNADGLMDWFSSAISHNGTDCAVSGCTFGFSGNKLYRNLGSRMFDDATNQAGVRDGSWGWGAAFLDFDNDGHLDLVMTNGFDTPSTTSDDMFQKGRMRLWRNLGSGSHGKTEEVSRVFGLNSTSQGRGLLKWDYDDDGDEDVVVCNNYGPALMYRNRGGNRNHYLRVQVQHRCALDHHRLCDSLGARVQVTSSDNHTQTQEIGSSTHFLGQSEMAAHFGLGRDGANVTVHVEWPADNKQMTYRDVPPNTRLRVVRPADGAQKQAQVFSSLELCPSLRVVAITKQPKDGVVTINPDGKSVSFQLKPDSDMRKLSSQVFNYRVALVPSPGGKPLTSNVSSYITFLFNSTGKPGDGQCKNGRRTGATPTPTDERRMDGIYNNKRHPTWAAAMETLTRDFPAAYADQVSMPSGACSPEQKRQGSCRYPEELGGIGSNRPSPRNISNVIFQQIEPRISARRLSDLHAHFGQFLVHDTDFSSPLPRFEFQSELNDVWLPIKVPKGDIHFDPRDLGRKYLPFVRSTYNRCSGRYVGTPREQINKITSFIDGSVVYGETEERLRHLRTFKRGKMKLGPSNILPGNSMGLANDNVVGREPSRLFVAGDTRANVQPGLVVLHSLFVREHNRLCDAYLNRHLQASDEEAFQYGRRIVSAELQSITFREYLPALLGGTEHLPAYQGYKEDVNAGIGNAMATAVFRFGHSQVNPTLWRLDADGSTSRYGALPLRDAYFAPERVAREGGLEPILRGAVSQAAQEIDTKMVDDLRNVLFPVGRVNGLDLAAMNIQRGRDHGLPDYNSARRSLGTGAITKFTDITKDPDVATGLRELYGDTDQIDLWVGGLAEDHEPGSELGPTFRQILVTNFLRLRDGDRFWYEKVLSEKEIRMVQNLTLSRIISLNTDFKNVPENVFFSSLYCADVSNHQCVPRDVTCHELNTCQATNSRLRRQVEHLRRSCKKSETHSPEMLSAKPDFEWPLVVVVVFSSSLVLLLTACIVVRRLRARNPPRQCTDALPMKEKSFENCGVQS